MKSMTTGKILISLVAVYAAFGSYIFDWNRTHIFNPRFTPHAKFHNAQDMLLGTATGLLSLWILWIQRTDMRNKLFLSVVLAGLYWVTQFGAIFFPGTALVDPEFARPGRLPEQLIVGIVMVLLLGAGLAFELFRTRHIKK